MLIAKNLIRSRAALNADILLFDDFDEIWVHDKPKTVTDALRSQQDCIVELRVTALVRLTCVQVQLESVTELHLDLHDLIKEAIDTQVVVLFVDQVKAGDQLRILVSSDDCIKLRLDMLSAEHLEAADDETHAEQRVALLNVLDARVEDCKFLLEWDSITIVVKQAAKDVLVLHHSDHFAHEVARDAVQNALKERLVVVKSERQLEFELEVLPDGMICALSGLGSADHLLSKVLVELFRVLPVLAQRVHLDEALLVAAFSRNEELVCTLRIVHAILVREREEELQGRAGSQVRMVHCRLGHQAQALVKWRVDQRGKLLVVVADVERVVVVDHSLAQRGQLVVHYGALVGEIDLACRMVIITVFLEQLGFHLVPLSLPLRRGINKSLFDLCPVTLLIRVFLHVGQLCLVHHLHLGICKAEKRRSMHQITSFHVRGRR